MKRKTRFAASSLSMQSPGQPAVGRLAGPAVGYPLAGCRLIICVLVARAGPIGRALGNQVDHNPEAVFPGKVHQRVQFIESKSSRLALHIVPHRP